MKMLVIGLDGGDERIIRALDMPHLQNLLDSLVSVQVEEDLWSRGWVEILSGTHGRESGGFYNKPTLDGSHQFTASFGSKDYDSIQDAQPIWRVLNTKGYRVGFLGVNTTMPPPSVDGYFLAGPGGGYRAQVYVPAAACFPKHIQSTLNLKGYVWEVRYGDSGVRDMRKLFELLRQEIVNRVQPFVELCAKFKTDFAFFHHKAPVVVQNLAMKDMEQLVASRGIPQTQTQREIVELYKCLDTSVGDVIEAIQPKHVMLVSDHGAAPYIKSINVNSLLQQLGFQEDLGRRMQNIRSVGKMAARALSKPLLKQLMRRMPTTISEAKCNWNRTRAFGARYVRGIYVNDERRFGGPVASECVGRVATELVQAFNSTTQALEHGLRARPYRAEYSAARFAKLLPDVWIDASESMFFESRGQFVEPNRNYRNIDSLRGVNRDMFSGTKGRRPLLVVDAETACRRETYDPSDLRLAYRLITRRMLA